MGKIVLGPVPERSGGSRLRAPEPLQGHHDRTGFECGKPILDDWLRKTAHKAEGLSARTFVVCQGDPVVGYYCLSTGSVMRGQFPTAKLRQNLPEHTPIVIIGRLAVDRRHRGRGIGAGLLKDAVLRAINISRDIGFRGIVVHALDDEAAEFYRKYGFLSCQLDPRTMILPLETARAAIS